MIPHTAVTWHTAAAPEQDLPRWQRELADVVRTPAELFRLLELDCDDLTPALRAAEQFALRVPRAFVARMRKGDPADPLLRQVLPVGDELMSVMGYTRDPLGENATNPVPGLIHKYAGRVLLILSPACAINCRYCFRRHFPYRDNQPSRAQWQQALDYIRADTSINEVIYSGGDPLATSDRQLRWLTEAIAAIDHVRRLRVHTRLPVVIPARITPDCLAWLTSTRLHPVIVLHINHPNEVDAEVKRAVAGLKGAGLTVLNQAVLLAGVNDSTETLCNLSEVLFAAGVLPYYLHLLDPVTGAAHFGVSDSVARALQSALCARLPGYLVPKMVREHSGAPSKVAFF